MYAGAAREAVFSRPEVMRRIQSDFVPLALRAPAVNMPDSVPDADERWLYQRINRAKLAPQGICVLNSAGQVFVWVQMFDDDQSVLDFLDDGLKRFRENADAKRPVVTERYVRFPSGRAKDVQNETKLPDAIAAGHPNGTQCPAKDGKGRVPPGSIVARLVGRALDEHGKPVADTVRQEHYVEDQFSVTPAAQQALTKVLANAGTQRVRLPDEFSRSCASRAHLGHIDVQPLLNMRTGPENLQGVGGQTQNRGEWKQCQFWAQPVASGGRQPPDGDDRPATVWRIDGETEVVSEVAINGRGVHDVKLTWGGFIEIKGNRITQLVLSARGREKLQFAKDDHPLLREKSDEVAFLPGGRPIDLACGVRYGIIGEPVADSEAIPAPDAPRVAASEPPAQEPARQLMEAIGPQLAVFLSVVQDDLNLSDQQKQMLQQMKTGAAEGLQQFMQQIQNAPDEERGKLHQQFREQANKQVNEVFAQLLQPEQQKRLRQIVLQQQRLFALADPEVAKELGFGNEQEKRFLMRIMEETQKRLQAFQQKAQEKIQQTAQATGDLEEVQKEAAKLQREAAKIRKEQEAKIEALLSDAQKEQWKAMLGKPLDLN